MKERHIQLEYSCEEEFDEQLEIAKEKFEELVRQGYPCVRIVHSSHPYSEGIWVEATNQFTELHPTMDRVIKTTQK